MDKLSDKDFDEIFNRIETKLTTQDLSRLLADHKKKSTTVSEYQTILNKYITNKRSQTLTQGKRELSQKLANRQATKLHRYQSKLKQQTKKEIGLKEKPFRVKFKKTARGYTAIFIDKQNKEVARQYRIKLPT